MALSRQWTKAFAILFAIGAVSGAIVEFEISLLWPTFTQYSGAIIGLPFALEGFAFFIEAIFIGLYLYGWDRLSPWGHWWCGVAIAASGAISGVLVVGVNAWMQLPVGIAMDATGLHAMERLLNDLRAQGMALVLSGTQAQPWRVMERSGFLDRVGRENVCPNIDAAIARARQSLSERMADTRPLQATTASRS